MRLVYFLTVRFLYFFFRFIVGMELVSKCNYKEIIKSKCIIAANHMSNFDPPIIGAMMLLPINYLAKEELFKFKPFGWLLRHLHAIPLRRGIIDKTALKNANKVLDNNQPILIFPEGSRKNFTAKAGIGLLAMNTQTKILPIHIENSKHMFKCLLRIKRLKVIIGDPIEVEYFQHWDLNKDNYRTLANYTLNKINSMKNIEN